MSQDLKHVFEQRFRPGMVVVSDVDGVHTSPQGGVRIAARPSQQFGVLFTLHNGVEVLELVAQGELAESVEYSIAGFSGEEIMEFYQFFTPDGQAVVNLLREGVRTVIVSGRNAAPVRDRFDRKLGAETYLGVRDKLQFFQRFGVALEHMIFIADGHQDAPLLEAVSEAGGIAVSPADGEPEAKVVADALTVAKGGEGAFAELSRAYLGMSR
jgi:YrbI family 3-deoxy-D-manno-octulosonate 8-phosphate phosphatase